MSLKPAMVHDNPVAESSLTLVEQAKAGNRQSFEELYQRFYPAVVRRLTHLCGPSAPVADLVQETFIHAYCSLHQYRREAPVQHWLLRIATNLARSHARQGRSRFWRLWSRPEDEDAVPSPLAALDETYPHLAAVHQGLRELSPSLREAVVLFELEGLSLHELAAQTGLPLNTAASRVRRGREQLRRILTRMGLHPSNRPAAALCSGEPL